MIPLTYPPAPFLSHAAGEEGGMIPLTFPLALLPLLHEARKGGGRAEQGRSHDPDHPSPAARERGWG